MNMKDESPVASAQGRKSIGNKRDSTAGFFANMKDDTEDDFTKGRKSLGNKRDSTAGFFVDLKNGNELVTKKDMKKRDSTAAFFNFADEEEEEEDGFMEPSMDLGADESFLTTETDIVMDNTTSILGAEESDIVMDNTAGDLTMDLAGESFVMENTASILGVDRTMDMDITTASMPVAQESFYVDMDVAPQTVGTPAEFSLSMMVDGEDSEDDEDCMQLDTFQGKDFQKLMKAEKEAEMKASRSPFTVGKSDIVDTMSVKDRVEEAEEEAPAAVHQLTPRKAPVKNNATLSNRSLRTYGGSNYIF